MENGEWRMENDKFSLFTCFGIIHTQMAELHMF